MMGKLRLTWPHSETLSQKAVCRVSDILRKQPGEVPPFIQRATKKNIIFLLLDLILGVFKTYLSYVNWV